MFLLLLGAFLPPKLAVADNSIIISHQAPKHEVRAVWLTTLGGRDWPRTYSQSPFSAKKQQAELWLILYGRQ